MWTTHSNFLYQFYFIHLHFWRMRYFVALEKCENSHQHVHLVRMFALNWTVYQTMGCFYAKNFLRYLVLLLLLSFSCFSLFSVPLFAFYLRNFIQLLFGKRAHNNAFYSEISTHFSLTTFCIEFVFPMMNFHSNWIALLVFGSMLWVECALFCTSVLYCVLLHFAVYGIPCTCLRVCVWVDCLYYGKQALDLHTNTRPTVPFCWYSLSVLTPYFVCQTSKYTNICCYWFFPS